MLSVILKTTLCQTPVVKTASAVNCLLEPAPAPPALPTHNEIPSSKVVTHDSYSHMSDFDMSDNSSITIDTSSLTSDYISTLTNTGVFSEDEFSAIYERPSDKVIRKRYTGHKKVQDISEVGIHTLEKMSKRGK